MATKFRARKFAAFAVGLSKRISTHLHDSGTKFENRHAEFILKETTCLAVFCSFIEYGNMRHEIDNKFFPFKGEVIRYVSKSLTETARRLVQSESVVEIVIQEFIVDANLLFDRWWNDHNCRPSLATSAPEFFFRLLEKLADDFRGFSDSAGIELPPDLSRWIGRTIVSELQRCNLLQSLNLST